MNRAAQILACYRKNCASPTSAGQLILPECLKLLPLYVSCLLKNDAFAGGSDMTVDDRSYAMYFVSTMDLKTSVEFFYPRLIPIHTVEAEGDDIPAPIRCTADKITDDGAYILGELENKVKSSNWILSKFSQQKMEFTCSSIWASVSRLSSLNKYLVFKTPIKLILNELDCRSSTIRFRRGCMES